MEERNVISAADRFLWEKQTLAYLKENLNDKVTHIDLSTNHIGVEAAKLIAQFMTMENSVLQGAYLVQCRFNHSAINILFEAIKSSKLIELYLDNNIITDNSCKILSQSLKSNPPLVLLSLCGCNLSAVGVQYIASALPFMTFLKHLRLESNSMYDHGANSIARVLSSWRLPWLSLADNQIWMGGTSEILKSVHRFGSVASLDLSYNIVDLKLLAQVIRESQALRMLAISGCKVKQEYVPEFLKSVQSSALSSLIMDGLNYNIMPVSWPKVVDKVFSDEKLFSVLLDSIKHSNRLIDLRVGFLSPSQIDAIRSTISALNPSRRFFLSLHDFGRTKNGILFDFQKAYIDHPTAEFEWKTQEGIDEKSPLGTLFKLCRYEEKQLSVFRATNCGITDLAFSALTEQLEGCQLVEFDISGNLITNQSIPKLIQLLTDNTVSTLRVVDTKISHDGLAKLVDSLLDTLFDNGPKNLIVSFVSDGATEHVRNPVFKTLSKLISSGYNLEKLSISGPISIFDVNDLVDSFATSSSLKSVELNSTFLSNYASPDPLLDQVVQDAAVGLADNLLSAISGTQSKSNLATFFFPYLTEVYIYEERVAEAWLEIEKVLESNADTGTQ